VFKFASGFVKGRPRNGRLDSRVTIACQTLEENPAIAICGLTMLMVAAAAAAMINGFFRAAVRNQTVPDNLEYLSIARRPRSGTR
jgi:hypothetical protein